MITLLPTGAILVTSLVLLAHLVCIVFCTHNIWKYIVGQKRYQGKGIFITLFYAFALANQLSMLAQIAHQIFNRQHLQEIFVLSNIAILMYLGFGLTQVWMLHDLTDSLKSLNRNQPP